MDEDFLAMLDEIVGTELKPTLQVCKEPIFVRSSTATKRSRYSMVTETGKSLGYTKSMNAHYAQDFYEGDPERVPGPTFQQRWDGICKFLPASWAETAKPVFERINKNADIWTYCLSCDKCIFEASVTWPSEFSKPIFALAAASDHWRKHMNHQIVLLDRNDNLIYRAPYKVLSMSW